MMLHPPKIVLTSVSKIVLFWDTLLVRQLKSWVTCPWLDFRNNQERAAAAAPWHPWMLYSPPRVVAFKKFEWLQQSKPKRCTPEQYTPSNAQVTHLQAAQPLSARWPDEYPIHSRSMPGWNQNVFHRAKRSTLHFAHFDPSAFHSKMNDQPICVTVR